MDRARSQIYYHVFGQRCVEPQIASVVQISERVGVEAYRTLSSSLNLRATWIRLATVVSVVSVNPLRLPYRLISPEMHRVQSYELSEMPQFSANNEQVSGLGLGKRRSRRNHRILLYRLRAQMRALGRNMQDRREIDISLVHACTAYHLHCNLHVCSSDNAVCHEFVCSSCSSWSHFSESMIVLPVCLGGNLKLGPDCSAATVLRSPLSSTNAVSSGLHPS